MNRASESFPEVLAASDRMPLTVVASPHPACVDPGQLLGQCEVRTQRRSGPGGQHRNKTSSGVFIHHLATEVVAEATERRSQAQNRSVALDRLRRKLACNIRSPSIFDSTDVPIEHAIRQTYRGGPLKVNPRNDNYPAILALLLNDLHATGGLPSIVAKDWQTTSSAIVRLVKTDSSAFTLMNRIRLNQGYALLK